MRLRVIRTASLALTAVLLTGNSSFAPLHAQSVTRPAGGDYSAQPHSGPRSVTRAAGATSPTTPAGSRGGTVPAGSAAGARDQRPSAAPRSAFRAVQRNAFGTPLEAPAPLPSRRSTDAVANSEQSPAPAYTRPRGSGPSDPVPQQTEPAGSGDYQAWPEPGALGTTPATAPTGADAEGGDTTYGWEAPGAGDTERFEPFGMRSLDNDASQTRRPTSSGAWESTGESSGQRWLDPVYAPDENSAEPEAEDASSWSDPGRDRQSDPAR